MQKKEKEEKNESRGTEAILGQIQMAEQFLQNLMMQKQLFQSEFVETNNALNELKKTKSNDEVFKIIGSIMFKSDKGELEKELEKKKELLNLRLKTIEKQEEELKEKVLKQRDELLKKLQK